MRRLHLNRIPTSVAAFIAVAALVFGQPSDLEVAALAMFTTIIARA